ncbi:filamentous hemagglutinin [Pseudomonas sp. SLBN-26]|uniref:two-partner secretion domain-containing protein n=1 Tax=Pseudomonadaceae TaxID=135621 RepID=UPI00114DD756|nr:MULTISPECIES: DUF637 domain-containing protein [Pseudomonas]MCP1616175.1 filamentous hemagglutinin [Pseudomonas otitidis]TQL05439.1 filamentous hemagglutinin [Pseudomonas sp. SLBN-26]
MDVRSPFFQNIATVLIGVMFLNPIVSTAADLAVDAAAGGNTSLGAAANGVPVVNIATPNGNGLSHNKFSDYNVGEQGLILNNATNKLQSTQLGGYILGNPNLNGRAAGVILNEVTGTNPSQLKGYTEVAGQGAHVIVANPHGITCDGCGFINTPRATLSTGAPVVENGALKRYDVDGGQIRIEGQGLNASNVDQFELITRSAQINAELHARQLAMVTGRNDVDATTLAATAKADDGTDKPQLAIDSSALGGMYAGAIRLVGTEQGVGVKLAGDMAASGGDIQIDANGKLTLSQAAASRDIALKAQSIELGNKTYAGRNVKAEAAQSLTLEKDRSLAAGAQIDLKAEQLGNQGVIEAGVNRDNSRNTTGDVKLSGGSLRNQGTVVASRDLEAALTDTLDNRAGAISGKANTRVAAKALDNRDDGLLLSKGSVTVDAESLDNRKGAIAADQSLNIKVAQRLDNQEGELSSRAAVTIDAGQLDNRGGQLSADRTLTVSADALDNSAKGTLSSRGSLVVQKAALNNQGGTVVADQRVDITGQRLDNRGGVVSSKGDASIAVEGVLDNAGPGRVVAEGALQVTARELRNSAAGQVGAKGDVEIKVDTLAQQGGELLSQGHLSLEARQLDNLSGGLIAARQGIDVRVSERLRNSGGEISTQGQADIRAQAIAGQAPAVLDNSQAGLISADQGLTLTVQRLLNHTKGVLTARDRLVVRGESLDNSAGGVINSQGSLDLSLQGGLVNQQGLITSTAGLHLEAASLDSSQGGEVSSKGDLRLSVARLIQQQGRLIGEAAVHLDLQDGDLDNRGGLLSAKGPLTLERLAKLDNRGGELSSRQGYNLTAQAIDNGDQGKLISTGQLDIDLGQGALRNAGTGLVSGWKGLTVKAGSLDNRGQGTLSSRDGDLQITLSDALDNRDGGALVGKGTVSVDAQSLDNRTGGVVSSVGDLNLTLADTLDNRTGQISSQQSASIHANRLDNSVGELTSKAAMTLTLTGQLLNAQKARLASGGPLVLQAAALDNRGGSLISQQLMKLTTGDLNNAGGTLAARNGLELLLSGVLDNSADGLVHSQEGLIDLQAQRLDNQGGSLSGQQGVVARLEGALNNRSGRIETAQGDLDLRSAGDLVNHGGVLNSLQGGLTVTSGGAFDNASGTAQAQAVTVTAKALDNQGGHLSALSGETRIALGTGTLQNQGGGLYAHQLLSVIAGDFDNRADSRGLGGKVAAERIDFTLSGALRNGNGLLESSSTLRLAAARIDNQHGRLRALGQAGSTRILGSALDNRNGTLETANAELALDVDDLYGTGGSIVHTGAGRFGLSTAQVMGGGGNLSTQGRLNLSASNWTNSGVLEADQLVLDIGTFTQTASGKLVARQSFSGSGENWINHGVLASDGSFTLNLSGAYTGQGQLSSLGELTLNTGSLDIASSARIAGGAASTLTVSGLLANQGRITSAGSLTARAGTLDNYGTLGSAGLLRLETPSLLNEKGLIFSGDDMALRVKRFTNRYADVYSLGTLSIASNDQLARSDLLENLSATLESAKDMRLAATTLLNAKDEFAMEGKLLSAQAYLICVQHCKKSWGDKRGQLTLNEEWGAVISKDSPAGQILAGANLQIEGDQVTNRYSTLSARNDIAIKAGDLKSIGAQAMSGSVQKVITANPKESNGVYYGHQARVQNFMAQHGTAATFSEAAYLAMKAGFSPAYYLGIDAPVSVSGSGQILAPAVIQAGGNVTLQASNNLDNLQTYPNTAINHGQARGADVSLNRAAQPVVVLNAQLPPDLQQRQVNPLTLPGFVLPQGDNGLFRLNTQAANDDGASQAQSLANSGGWQVQGSQAAGSNPVDTGTRVPSGVGQVSLGEVPVKGHKYLIETNPAFADLARFLSSDYMLGKLGYDPDQAQRRLGDGLFEQRLIREAVVARTGQRYLAGLTSDEAMFRYLMDNAIASKQALNLALGVSLSAEQVAALTHDIVWMEEHEVQGEKVLVPVLYLAQAQGRVAPNGALIQGRDVTLISGGSLNNQGTLKASQNLSASAVNLTNSGSMQAGERLSLLATESIRNAQGGIIAGRDVSVKALSGDIINERSVTTFESGGSNYTYRKDYVDGAARIEALNDLDLGAGRDVQNVGGGLSAGRDLRIDAGRDLLIVSAEQHDLSSQKDRKGNSRREQITQYGSDVSAGRDLTLSSDRDLAVVASRVKAGDDLTVKADGNVLIGSAANESHYESHRKSRGKKEDIEQSRVTKQGAELIAGGDLSVKAGEDLNVVASQLKAGDEAYLYAGKDIQLLAAQDSEYSLYDKKKKGSFGAKETRRDEVTDVRNVGTQITSGGDLTLASEGDQLYQRARLESGGNLTLDSGGEIAFEAVKDLHQESHEKSKSDLAWNSMKGKGSTDETLLQSQLIAQGEIVIKAADGLKIDIKQIDQKTVSQTIDAMVAADPQLAWIKAAEQRGDVDWRQVKEIHDAFKYSNSGLGAGAQLVIAIVMAAVVGPAAAGALGTVGGAAATSLATTGTISTINNKGNLGAALKETFSKDSLKSAAVAGVTAGLTSSYLDDAFGVKPENVNHVTKGFDIGTLNGFGNYGGYLAAQGGVQAVTKTAIQGGSFEENLKVALTSQGQQLLQAGVFNWVGGVSKEMKWSDGSPQKVAFHALMGGLLSKATGGDFATGAAAAGASEALIERLSGLTQGNQNLEQMSAQIIGVLAAAAVNGDINKGAEIAKSSTTYNRQLHPDEIKFATDDERVKRYAKQVGISEDDARRELLRTAAAMVDRGWSDSLGELDGNTQQAAGFLRTELSKSQSGLFRVTLAEYNNERLGLKELFNNRDALNVFVKEVALVDPLAYRTDPKYFQEVLNAKGIGSQEGFGNAVEGSVSGPSKAAIWLMGAANCPSCAWSDLQSSWDAVSKLPEELSYKAYLDNLYIMQGKGAGVLQQNAASSTQLGVEVGLAVSAGAGGVAAKVPTGGTILSSNKLGLSDLGPLLGRGGNKDVFAYGDLQAVGVLRVGKKTSILDEELRLLRQLDEVGIPTVNARGPVLVGDRPALIFDRYAQGSKDVVKLTDGKVRIVGESELLNQRSVEDLQEIRRIMVENNVRVKDLQFLIGKDGRVVVSDPLDVDVDKGPPSRNNLRMIDLLIQQAQKGRR